MQDFDQILSWIFFLQDHYKICYFCKKSVIFSARLARYVQYLMQDLAIFAWKKYLQHLHISYKTILLGTKGCEGHSIHMVWDNSHGSIFWWLWVVHLALKFQKLHLMNASLHNTRPKFPGAFTVHYIVCSHSITHHRKCMGKFLGGNILLVL